MFGFLVTLAAGALVCFFGIQNMRGDISSLHSYHRNNVSPEDVKPFGKLVGIGTLLVGVGVITMSAFSLIAELSGIEFMVYIGMGVMGTLMVVGMVVTFYAMKKYNGGIFG